MSEKFSRESQQILASANQEAAGLGHEYVGTEHLLLALINSDTGTGVEALRTLGASPASVRQEIEKLVSPGPCTSSHFERPLTPRAKRVFDHAIEIARIHGQKSVDAEHLLLGLLRANEGVAAEALVNLEIDVDAFHKELFKNRLLQLKIVERAVRPVHATVAHKRKMREELLAHLSVIYDDELARQNDPAAALTETARRFGDPGELSRELELALPLHERISHWVERWFVWRAPESAARYCWRLAVQTLVMLMVILGLVGTGLVVRYGWIDDTKTVVRLFAAITLMTPAAQFTVSVLYFKIRDALWGAFGSRKSIFNVSVLTALVAVILPAFLFAAALAATHWNWARASESLPMGGIAGLTTAAMCVLLARFNGRTEICDAHWALLDIDGPKSEPAA